MSTSTFSSEQIVKLLFTTNALGTRPTAWYAALHTGYPGLDGAANEVIDAAYVRQQVTFTPALVNGTWQATSDAAATFPAADGTYTVSYVTVFSAATAGTCLAVLRLVTPRAIPIGGIFSLPAGELVVSTEAI